jgi:hypothetical protein
VQWSGTNESLIRLYSVWVSDNGAPFTLWIGQGPGTAATFHGLPGHTYGFYSIACDRVYVCEQTKTAAEATTHVPAALAPISRVSPLPATQPSSTFVVKWSRTGSVLIQDYTIYMSDNGGPFVSWQPQTTATQATFTGVSGHTYGFYSIGRTAAGVYENPKTAAEATTKIVQAAKPVSHVSALPATASSPNFRVQWSGTATGTTIRDYTIYVSDNGGAYALWLNRTKSTEAWFPGRLGYTYRFFSIARDNAGNTENMKTGAEATTQVPAVMPADVNGDTRIDCSDVAVVKLSLGKKTGQLGFDPRADVNKDGVVDIRDLAAVTQKLAPTTTCS